MTEDPAAIKPPDFAALARRIGSWTSKCLLTLIVLVAGLAFGRQVLRWWAEDEQTTAPAQTIALPADRLGDPAAPHTIEFGDSPWSMRRQTISGDRAQAIERLRAVCREMLDTISPLSPPTIKTPSEEKAAGFLATLEKTKPTAESPGRWRLYEFHETFPMIAGIAESPRRVLLWGMAIPAGPTGWTLCVFQPIVGQVANLPQPGGRQGRLATCPTPPDARKTLSLRVDGGGAIVAFVGGANPSQWISFYNDWSKKNDWRRPAAWQMIGTAWHAKFIRPDRDGGGSLDIRFGPDNRGGFSGLGMLSPHESR